MKYIQPYGISDPAAAYINGNPATGTMGSIPPAASIEHDMREIVHVIQWAYDHGYRDNTGALCAAPTDLDLQQLRKAIFGFINSDKLALNLDYYVSNFGNDSNNGLSPGTAFATIQKAVNESQKFDPNGFVITIHVADGTYAAFGCGAGVNLKGWGTTKIIGNTTTPSLCLINTVSAVCAGFNGHSREYHLGGFKFINNAVPPQGGHAVVASETFLNLYNCDFGNCGWFHIWSSNAYVVLSGLIDNIPGISYPKLTVSGNAVWHMRASEGGAIGCRSPDMVISAPVSFSGGWVIIDTLSHSIVVNDPYGSQPNYYNSLSGKANVTAGARYAVSDNSILNTRNSGAAYFPGTTPGSVATGGQYS